MVYCGLLRSAPTAFKQKDTTTVVFNNFRTTGRKLQMTYSLDFRRLALRLLAEHGSFRRAARICKISTSTLHAWHKNGPQIKKRVRRRLSDACREQVRQLLESQPVTTLRRVKQEMMTRHRLRIGLHSLRNLIHQIGWSRKRTSKRGLRSASNERRDTFLAAAQALSATDLIVSVDECYFSEKVLPLYGYSPIGEKCTVSIPVASWRQRSLLLAVASDGSRFHQVFTGAVNKQRFQAFVQSMPFPPTTTVLMDNVAFHKDLAPFKEKAYSALYTPPYSPEFNPVENVFSVVKHAFRTAWPWDQGVDFHVHKAVECSTPETVCACFDHWKRLVTGT